MRRWVSVVRRRRRRHGHTVGAALGRWRAVRGGGLGGRRRRLRGVGLGGRRIVGVGSRRGRGRFTPRARGASAAAAGCAAGRAGGAAPAAGAARAGEAAAGARPTDLGAAPARARGGQPGAAPGRGLAVSARARGGQQGAAAGDIEAAAAVAGGEAAGVRMGHHGALPLGTAIGAPRAGRADQQTALPGPCGRALGLGRTVGRVVRLRLLDVAARRGHQRGGAQPDGAQTDKTRMKVRSHGIPPDCGRRPMGERSTIERFNDSLFFRVRPQKPSGREMDDGVCGGEGRGEARGGKARSGGLTRRSG